MKTHPATIESTTSKDGSTTQTGRAPDQDGEPITAAARTSEDDISEDLHERMERAARPCPEEFRPAYIHLLEQLHSEIYESSVVSTPYLQFEGAILTVLIGTPEIDPWDLAEIAECFPQCRDFAEDLRMLSRLRQRDHI